ncbi:hypothetical protein B0I35DRAFT_466950 [Stachybotrys elegans]|uniref:Voltage-gated hydrogen channel 1 n=1 Tax=Stachybotrys elegans TaxID=80388 RepID=A0A8K0SYZ6_9HYPO|nr:hypothetical protein B0I35DRAFT_466950 [Stachybotrys elegans]
MAPDHSPTRPLLPPSQADGEGEEVGSRSPSRSRDHEGKVEAYRAKGRDLLGSRTKHYVVMGVVAFDVAALLGNIFLQLISCEMHQRDEPWVQQLTKALTSLGLVFSCVFMVELIACVFSYGISYFSTWFHVFDSVVIVLSFFIDFATQGLTESIGSLVVVLRLWRLAKISEEMVLGSVERVDFLEQHIEELEAENSRLRSELEGDSQRFSAHE